MRWLSLFVLVFLLSFPLALAPPHVDYPGFSAHEYRLAATDGLLVAQDDLVYHRAYYSIAGGDWFPVSLQGTNHKGSARWLSGSASASLPVFGDGEHYVIVYSCSRASLPTGERAWDCHDARWQLHVIDNTPETLYAESTSFASVTASSYQEGGCGGDCGPENLFDGSFAKNSRWSTDERGGSVTFEFEETVVVDALNIAFYDGDTRTHDFALLISQDGDSWTKVFQETSDGQTFGFETYSFEQRPVKYARLLGYGNDGVYPEWTSVLEVQFLHKGVVVAPSNVEVNDDDFEDPDPDDGDDDYDFPVSSCDGRVIVYEKNFEDSHLGKYTSHSDFQNDWQTNEYGSRWDRLEVVQGAGANPSKVFHVDFPYYDSNDFRYICWGVDMCSNEIGGRKHFLTKPSFGSSYQLLNGVGVASGGAQWDIPFSSGDELYVSYKIMFAEDFNGVDGGKLPGFGGGSDKIGPNVDDDGDGTSDRFAARLMFKGGLAGDPVGLVFYVYYPSKPGQYGESFPFNKKLNPGQWHTITQRAVMNTLNKDDGILEAWIDGDMVLSQSGFDFRVGDAAKFNIEHLIFTTYFGGHSERLCDTDGMDVQCRQGFISDNYRSKYNKCAVNPSDPCSDIIRYSDGSPVYYYAPRKDEHIYFDDVIVYYYDSSQDVVRGHGLSSSSRREIPPPVGNRQVSGCES